MTYEIRTNYIERDEVKPIGKTISAAFINEDKTSIRFDLSNGTRLFLHTEGDCCSETWIEHVDNFEYATRATITGTETVSLGECIATRQDSDQLYAAYISVEHPKYPQQLRLAIEFRNSSNGYYGGDIEWSARGNLAAMWIPLDKDF